jgi:O-antigen/teichoic acid export membrane protein
MLHESTAVRAAPQRGAGSVAANSLWLLTAQIASKLAGVALLVPVTRSLGVEGYGAFALAFAFAALFAPFLDLGMDAPSTRAVVLDPRRAGDVLDATLLAKGGLGLIALPIGAACAALVGPSGPALPLLACAMVTSVLTALAASYLSVFRAWQRMDLEAVTALVLRAATCIGVLIAAWRWGGVLAVALAYAAGALAGLVFAAGVAARHGLRPAWTARRAQLEELVRAGVPFVVTALLVTLYFRIDTLMLAAFHGERSVGLYNAAAGLMLAAMMFSQAVVTAVFPVVAHARSLGDPIARPVVRRALVASLAMAAPIALVGAAGAPVILRTLYGEAYAGAAGSLAILMSCLPVLFVTNLIGQCLGALGRQRTVLAVSALNAAVNVLLNFALIPRFDLEGAAAATLATELFGLCSYGVVLRRELAALLAPEGTSAEPGGAASKPTP